MSPELIGAYAATALPERREPAPEDPALEPVVSLGSMVLALGDSLGAGLFTLEGETALAVELQLSALIDAPVLSRAEATRQVDELASRLGPRRLIALSGMARAAGHAYRPWLLGVESATANPFYNPGSLPGHGARFVLAHIGNTLRAATE